MRGLRTTLALAVVLVALGGYIYFFASKQTDDEGSKRDKVFAALDTEKIDEIHIKPATGEATRVKKENGAWRITEPVATKADENEVSSLTRTLGTLEMTRVVDENPAELKDYGLQSPRLEIEFTGADSKGRGKLLIGEKAPTGGDLFAMREGEKRVFLIPAYQETAFSRSTFDLRDKTVLQFDRSKVDGVQLTFDGRTVQLGKDGGDWKLLKPLTAKADYGTAEGLLSRLQTAQAKSVEASEATAANLKKYGLDKPAVTVDVNAGSARTTLLVGSKAADKTYYARDASKDLIVTIDAVLAEDLKRPSEDYRRKDVFESRSYNVNSFEITSEGPDVFFDLRKGEGGKPNTWRRVRPNPEDVESAKFDPFLNKLTGLRGTAFVAPTAKTGLDKPVMRITARFDETKLENVAFARPNDNEAYIQREGDSDAMKIDVKELDEVVKALGEISR